MSAKQERRLTMPVVEAGEKYFGLARNASYRAARTGSIPCVVINGRRLASIPAIEAMINAAGKTEPEDA
jgi:hypothetical protein